jgi:hypothetical protein
MPSQRLFRSSDQHLRVSDADRHAVADELARHYGEGRLDKAEFDERVSQTMNAKTRGDLSGLFDDLPDLDVPDAGAPAGSGGIAGRPGRTRRSGRTADRAADEAADGAADGAAGPAAGFLASRPAGRAERTGPIRPVLMLILVVVVATAAWHALAWTFIPWLWIAILVVAVLFATGHLGRPRG